MYFECFKNFFRTHKVVKRFWDKIVYCITETSQNTFSRWIRQVLSSAGIDLSLFSSHSTRSAATSAVEKRVPVNTILKAASWQKECTFWKFYNKPAMDTGFFKAIISIV